MGLVMGGDLACMQDWLSRDGTRRSGDAGGLLDASQKAKQRIGISDPFLWLWGVDAGGIGSSSHDGSPASLRGNAWLPDFGKGWSGCGRSALERQQT